MAYDIADRFPDFADGDVKIVISPVYRYKLHSLNLKRSNVFAQLLLESPGATLSKQARDSGTTTRYCIWYEPLVTGHTFRRVDVDKNGKIKKSFGISINDGMAPSKMNTGFDIFFKMLYNEQGVFNNLDLDMTIFYAESAMECAEKIQAAHVIVERIEQSMLAHGPDLLKAIAQDPAFWLGFSDRLMSQTIFQESLIHLVGRLPALKGAYQRPVLDSIPTRLHALIMKKREDLVARCDKVESLVAELYPSNLIPVVVDSKVPEKHDYGKEVYRWMAMTIFKGWYAGELAHGKGHGAQDTGCALYRTLYEGGDAYLPRYTYAGFFKTFPMGEKGKRALHAEMDDIKLLVSGTCAPILDCKCKLNNPGSWLTCTVVRDEDIPFDRDAEVRKADGANRDFVREADKKAREDEKKAKEDEKKKALAAFSTGVQSNAKP